MCYNIADYEYRATAISLAHQGAIKLIILQFILALAVLVVAPLASGGILIRKGDNCICSYAYGWIVMMAIFLPVALICTFLNKPLTMLTIIWFFFTILAVVFGVYRIDRLGYLYDGIPQNPWVFIKRLPERVYHAFCLDGIKGSLPVWIIVCVIAAAQILYITIMSHTDADDSWYVATAVTDLYTNTVGVYAPDTGEVTTFAAQMDYLLNPWPVMLASLAQCTFIAPAVLAHTLLPACVFMASCGAFFMLGHHIFEKKEENVCKFMLFFLVASFFGNFSVRSQSVFMLMRPWQGKAFAAAMLLPMMFLEGAYSNEKNEHPGRKGSILRLFAVNLACITSSGMSMILAGLIAVCYAVVGLFKARSLKHFIKMLLTLVPSGIVGLIYLAI